MCVFCFCFCFVLFYLFVCLFVCLFFLRFLLFLSSPIIIHPFIDLMNVMHGETLWSPAPQPMDDDDDDDHYSKPAILQMTTNFELV